MKIFAILLSLAGGLIGQARTISDTQAQALCTVLGNVPQVSVTVASGGEPTRYGRALALALDSCQKFLGAGDKSPNKFIGPDLQVEHPSTTGLVITVATGGKFGGTNDAARALLAALTAAGIPARIDDTDEVAPSGDLWLVVYDAE